MESRFHNGEMVTDPETARAMLTNADNIEHSVRRSDTLRRNVYLVQALVVVLCVAPFDLFRPPVAVVACVGVIAVGGLLTVRTIWGSQVVNQEAMRSYVVVIASWSVLWALLMVLVGPWLSERMSIGWTLTGLIGAIPFLAGLVLESRR